MHACERCVWLRLWSKRILLLVSIVLGLDVRGGRLKLCPSPPMPPLSAQISATTKRGCRPWAGSPWGPGNRGADLLLPLPPPTEMGPDRKRAQHTPPPPACPRTLALTAGRHMGIKVPPHMDREQTPNDEYVGIWDPHGNPAGGPPLPNK